MRLTSALPILLLLPPAACTGGPAADVVFPPGGTAIDSTGRQERHWLTVGLTEVARIGSDSESDTTFKDPYLMEAAGGQVFFVEAEQQVVAYDTLGRLRWVRGANGSGPGEYRNIRDLAAGPGGSLWLLDPNNSRITELDRSGATRRMIRVTGSGHSEQFAPLPGRFAVFPGYDADVVYIGPSGDRTGIDTIPWAPFATMETLARQFTATTDPISGHWVLTFSYGNGWFAFDSLGQSEGRRFFVEPTRFPAVVVSYPERGSQMSEMVRTERSAVSTALQGDTLFVLFEGLPPDTRRKVDMYSWRSGNYLGSWKLPVETDMLALDGPWTYLFHYNPIPRVTIYRRGPMPPA